MGGAPPLPDGISAEAWLAIGAEAYQGGWKIPERDANGTTIGWATRSAGGKKFFIPGGHRGLTHEYPLPDGHGISDDLPILVVEGATDVAAAHSLRLAAVGRPMATGGVKLLGELLVDTHIAFIGENDNGVGETSPYTIGKQLVEHCASVRVVFPPKEYKDLRAWVMAGATADDVLGVVRLAEPLESKQASVATHDSDAKKNSPNMADRLVNIALDRYRFGMSKDGEPFAVPSYGPSIVMPFRGSRDALRASLSREYRREHGSTPNASAVADALTALEGEALEAEPERLELRVAALPVYGHSCKHDDYAEPSQGVVIDLGRVDGRVVVVRPGGWEVADCSPVLFRRTALTGKMPEPVRGGNLNDLRSLFNVTDESWPVVVGWLVSAMLPNIPHPILLLGGEQGTGKSTAAKLLASMVDPSPAPLRSEPRDSEGWAMMASGSWVIVIDNVSTIPVWWSDALCKVVTGDGLVRRRLYSDSSLAVLNFRRCVMLTSIDAGAMRGDLGDRLAVVDLETIPDECRRTDAEIGRNFDAMQPAMLGALFDVAARTLAELPRVNLTSMPRMADFARVLAALDTAAPELTGGNALPLYLGQRSRIAEGVIEGDLVAEAVRGLVQALGEWHGTSGDLLERITPQVERPRGWPANGQAMTARLKRLKPALNMVGVVVEIPSERTSRGRIITLAQSEGGRKRLSASSQLSPIAPEVPQDGIASDHPGLGTTEIVTGDRHCETGHASPPDMFGDSGDNRDDLSRSISAGSEREPLPADWGEA